LKRIGEKIGPKVRTTLYLSKDAKRLVDDEIENFSQWVEEKVFTCLSCETVDSVLEKKEELLSKVKSLDLRLAELEKRNSDVSVENSLSKQALDELRGFYSTRMEAERSRSENIAWIVSPKNIGRCKILKKSPEQVLDELEAWFDGCKTSEHEKD